MLIKYEYVGERKCSPEVKKRTQTAKKSNLHSDKTLAGNFKKDPTQDIGKRKKKKAKTTTETITAQKPPHR